MIKLSHTDGGSTTIEAILTRPPAIYLDHAPLADLSHVGLHRERFLDLFRHKGTLLFSWTNAMELAGPLGGTKRRMREVLDAVGEHWIPLELNPYKVVRKEQGIEPSSGTPCVSESFLGTYYRSAQGSSPTLAQVVDLVHEKREHIRANAELIKAEVYALVSKWRSVYTEDPSRLDQMLPPEPWDSARPATFILRELERLVVREAKSHTWEANDGVDFMHAAVGGAYADLIMLDQHWKRRILEVAPVREYPWVFYPNPNELDQFLDIFERCAVPQTL